MSTTLSNLGGMHGPPDDYGQSPIIREMDNVIAQAGSPHHPALTPQSTGMPTEHLGNLFLAYSLAQQLAYKYHS